MLKYYIQIRITNFGNYSVTLNQTIDRLIVDVSAVALTYCTGRHILLLIARWSVVASNLNYRGQYRHIIINNKHIIVNYVLT